MYSTWPLVGQVELIVTIILLIWAKTPTKTYSNKFHQFILNKDQNNHPI